MTMIIEIQSRDWDVENVTRALALPVHRQYVARLTVDSPNDAKIVFDQDVQLLQLDGDVLHVEEWDENTGQGNGRRHAFSAEDIRRVEFY